MIHGYKTKFTAFFVSAALCIVFAGFAGIHSGFTSQVPGSEDDGKSYPKSITVEQAAEKRDKGAFILDVRESYEWQQEHIPGSKLIPLNDLQNRLNELPEDRDIVVVCRSGNRSMMGLDIIRGGGFEKSSSMNGGILAWTAAGLPVESVEKKASAP